MSIDRRNFLIQTMSAALVVGAGSTLAACGGLARGDLAKASVPAPAGQPLDERRRRILGYAALAPSGHNIQPWVVKPLGPDEWIIGADPERRLPAVDPLNREVMLSLGAFSENLALAAGALGLTAEMEVLAQSSLDTDVLRVRLSEGTPTDYPLARLEKRLTVKQGYLNRELASDDVKALAEPLGGHLHYFPRGTDHARCLEEGAVEAFRQQTARDEAQAELVRWLRLSQAEVKRHRDGLTTAGMEILGIKGWVVRNFVSPRDFLKPSFRKQSVELTARLAGRGGGWFIITGKGNNPADLIDSGRRFEKMALLARERNIALHPMTQWLEENTGREKIAANHSAAMIPQFVLRVGYLENYPDPVSPRRPVEWFLNKL
ncbi:MAG: hypothetical protein AB1641_17030 [Thermodesulfobacteriota bacterium]